MLLVWATLEERGGGIYSRGRVAKVLGFVKKKKKLPPLIFLRLGSLFIGLPNHLSTHSAVLIGKKEAKINLKPGSAVCL